jgi:hypothetical protein
MISKESSILMLKENNDENIFKFELCNYDIKVYLPKGMMNEQESIDYSMSVKLIS